MLEDDDYEPPPPIHVSPEAWKAAVAFANEIEIVLTELGLFEREGHSRLTQKMGELIQLAIDEAVARRLKSLNKSNARSTVQ